MPSLSLRGIECKKCGKCCPEDCYYLEEEDSEEIICLIHPSFEGGTHIYRGKEFSLEPV